MFSSKFINNLSNKNRFPSQYLLRNFNVFYSTKNNKQLEIIDENGDNFPVLKILPYGKVQKEQKTILKLESSSPRYKRLTKNHDWSNVWPTPRNFHPSTVPLPIHMSYVEDNKLEVPIAKFNNPELLKIPNFLHLTPVTVKKQCEALKRFCTKWPSALKTDEDCNKYFPLNVVTKDFVFSGPSIRWPDSRIVEITLKLSDLNLDEHARDKMRRLLDHRYNSETDIITIRTDSCPLRKQNYDYGQYLLTVLFFESWKTEKWESEKEYTDWERYFWNVSKSRSSLLNYYQKLKIKSEKILENENTKNYADAVSRLYDEKESSETLNRYKESVVKILF